MRKRASRHASHDQAADKDFLYSSIVARHEHRREKRARVDSFRDPQRVKALSGMIVHAWKQSVSKEPVVLADDDDSENRVPDTWRDWRPYMVQTQRPPTEARWYTFPDDVFTHLSNEQAQALRLLEAGENVFITGPGGTGKSHLIDAIRDHVPHVAITASTGIAALHARGTTLHRFAGLGLASQSLQTIMGKIRSSAKGKDDPRIAPWLHIRSLVLDEAAMLTQDYLDKLDHVARYARTTFSPSTPAPGRGTAGPFGGIQLIFLGDLAQLTASEINLVSDSPKWSSWVPYTVLLRTTFRQKESTFIDALNRLRVGKASERDFAVFNACAQDNTRALSRRVHDSRLELFPYRRMVAQLNESMLHRCDEPDHIFRHRVAIVGRVSSKTSDAWIPLPPGSSAYSDARYGLRRQDAGTHSGLRAFLPTQSHDPVRMSHDTKGTRPSEEIMHTVAVSGCDVYDDAHVPTGSASKDMRCGDDDTGQHRPVVDADDLTAHVRRAITSLDIEAGDQAAQKALDTSIVEMGMIPYIRLRLGAHVLLQRNLSVSEGLVNGTAGRIVGFTEYESTESEKEFVVSCCTEPNKRYKYSESGSGWPVVEFFIGDSRIRSAVSCVQTYVPLRTPRQSSMKATALEIHSLPLICAWGITVHRAQGMSLDRVVVHANQMTRPAQLYTALSRVRSSRGLIVVGSIGRHNAHAHPRAQAYYEAIDTLQRLQGDLFVLESKEIYKLALVGKKGST